MKIPGAVYTLLWAVLIAAINAGAQVLEQYLGGEYADWVWAPVVLALVGSFLKWFNTYKREPEVRMMAAGEPEQSKARTFWLG